jgi:hypothetical protein
MTQNSMDELADQFINYLLVEKGLVGLLIDLGVVFLLLVLKWPAVR